jgi:hypothetical protein
MEVLYCKGIFGVRFMGGFVDLVVGVTDVFSFPKIRWSPSGTGGRPDVRKCTVSRFVPSIGCGIAGDLSSPE